MIYKLNNGGTIKLQSAWTTIPLFDNTATQMFEAAKNSGAQRGTQWYEQNKIVKEAEEKARKQVESEKPKYTYVNPYDYLRGWRESTEDAARQNKYTVKNLGGSKEEAEAAYNATKENAAKQLAGTTATGLGTVALLGLSGGAAGPVVADIVNTGFGAHGIYNALSGNGIQKTVRLANQGDTWGAVKSGAGDLLDLSMGLHAAKLWGNLGKSILAGQSLGNAYRGNVAGREMIKEIETTPNLPIGPLRHAIKTSGTPEYTNFWNSRYELFDTLTGKPIGKLGTTFDIRRNTFGIPNEDIIIGTEGTRGVSRALYNAALHDKPEGLISGDMLVHPEITEHVWTHFPREIVSVNGGTRPKAEDGSPVFGPIVRLKQPETFIPTLTENKVIPFTPVPQKSVSTVYFDPKVKPMSRPISEVEWRGVPKGERNSKIKESVLNWSWQDWFKDRINGTGHIKPNDFDKQSLYRHIPEYRQIEIATKRDGTWLKMPDGSIFEGDPREWVMAQSKAAQGLNFNDYYKLGSGQKPGYTIYFESQRNAPTMIDEIKGNFEGTPGRPAWLTNFEHAKRFANDGRGIGYTYKVYPQKDVTKANFDLRGLDWDSIPVDIVKELNIPVSNGFISTNRIVSESPAQIIHLNNVAEGSGGIQNLVDDVIIKGKRKSILGNNGNFDWNNEVIWRKQGGILKAQHGKPSYQDWLKAVSPDFIDKNYDLETAYNNLPFELLEAWRIDPENNHLPSGVELQNGNWQYLKSPLHKSWFLNNAWEMTKEGKEWKQKYIGDKKFPFETLILKG